MERCLHSVLAPLFPMNSPPSPLNPLSALPPPLHTHGLNMPSTLAPTPFSTQPPTLHQRCPSKTGLTLTAAHLKISMASLHHFQIKPFCLRTVRQPLLPCMSGSLQLCLCLSSRTVHCCMFFLSVCSYLKFFFFPYRPRPQLSSTIKKE